MKKYAIIFFAFFPFVAAVMPMAVSAQPQENDMTSAIKGFSQLSPNQKDMVLASMGVPETSGFSVAKIMAWLIFGAVGFVAFVYGKKQTNVKALIIGLVLLIYPYFTNNTFWLYAIGTGLCLALYFWRD